MQYVPAIGSKAVLLHGVKRKCSLQDTDLKANKKQRAKTTEIGLNNQLQSPLGLKWDNINWRLCIRFPYDNII
jgi:hypothetical protein